jgi:hypothetical protein
MILRLGMDAPNGQGGLCQILLRPEHPIRLPFVLSQVTGFARLTRL